MNQGSTSTSEPRVERPWGWYQTLEEGMGHKIKRIGVHPGARISLQKHHQRAEHWVVVQGEAQVTVGVHQIALKVGQHVDIPLGEVHRMENCGAEPLAIIELQFGRYLGEDDIVRLQDDYGRG